MNRLDGRRPAVPGGRTTAAPGFSPPCAGAQRNRQAAIGPNVTLYFEDRLTVQYQIQEMLRIERIFEAEAIADELGVYNPLIPDGTNLKATMMIEYPDADERKVRASGSAASSTPCPCKSPDSMRVVAHADEDLGRSNEEKTSAVHFLRFELTAPMRTALRAAPSCASPWITRSIGTSSSRLPRCATRSRRISPDPDANYDSSSAPQRATICPASHQREQLCGRSRSKREIDWMTESYRAADIEVLSGFEPVRRRPGMYTDTTRPNHLAHEVVDNSVDEASPGTRRRST